MYVIEELKFLLKLKKNQGAGVESVGQDGCVRRIEVFFRKLKKKSGVGGQWGSGWGGGSGWM